MLTNSELGMRLENYIETLFLVLTKQFISGRVSNR